MCSAVEGDVAIGKVGLETQTEPRVFFPSAVRVQRQHGHGGGAARAPAEGKEGTEDGEVGRAERHGGRWWLTPFPFLLHGAQEMTLFTGARERERYAACTRLVRPGVGVDAWDHIDAVMLGSYDNLAAVYEILLTLDCLERAYINASIPEARSGQDPVPPPPFPFRPLPRGCFGATVTHGGCPIAMQLHRGMPQAAGAVQGKAPGFLGHSGGQRGDGHGVGLALGLDESCRARYWWQHRELLQDVPGTPAPSSPHLSQAGFEFTAGAAGMPSGIEPGEDWGACHRGVWQRGHQKPQPACDGRHRSRQAVWWRQVAAASVVA